MVQAYGWVRVVFCFCFVFNIANNVLCRVYAFETMCLSYIAIAKRLSGWSFDFY